MRAGNIEAAKTVAGYKGVDIMEGIDNAFVAGVAAGMGFQYNPGVAGSGMDGKTVDASGNERSMSFSYYDVDSRRWQHTFFSPQEVSARAKELGLSMDNMTVADRQKLTSSLTMATTAGVKAGSQAAAMISAGESKSSAYSSTFNAVVSEGDSFSYGAGNSMVTIDSVSRDGTITYSITE